MVNPKLSTVSIWALGLLIFVGLAVKDIYPLVDEYEYNNLGTKMEIVAKNDTTKPPSLTFCIPHSPLGLQRILGYLTNNTIEFEKANATFTKLIEHVRLQPDNDSKSVDAWIFKNFATAADFDSNLAFLHFNNTDWNQPIFEAVRIFFECVLSLDNGKIANPCSSLDLRDIDPILSKKSRIDKLFNALISLLCHHVQLGAWGGENKCAQTLKSVSTAFYTDAFCFELPMFDNGATLTIFSRTVQGELLGLTDISRPFTVYADTALVAWPGSGVEGNDILYSSETGLVQLLFAQENVNLKYHVQSTVAALRRNKKSDCYKESTPSVCVSNCMIGEIIKICHCTPFSFRNNANAKETRNSPYCTSGYYSNETCKVKDSKELCNAKCKEPCEYVSYQWHSSKEIILGSYGENRVFKLTLKPVSCPYVEFKVVEKQTWEQFVANVAGIFSFYFGISGLTCVALLIKFVNLYFEKRAIRKRLQISSVIRLKSVDRNPNRYLILENLERKIEGDISGIHVVLKELMCSVRNLERKMEMKRRY